MTIAEERRDDTAEVTAGGTAPGPRERTTSALTGEGRQELSSRAGMGAKELLREVGAVLRMSEAEAARRGVTPLARIVSWATAGVDPAIMGSGPIPASRKALQKAGWSVGDLDLIEANEAFAAQACAVNKDMGWDTGRINVNGGAIALGHPIGASGTRILVTLLHEMKRRDARRGLASLCIGGGMGVALAVER